MAGQRELRIAIVGAGVMGRWHARYAAAAGAEIAAVVDPNGSARQRLAVKHGHPAEFADLVECLTNRPVDVVHICTPAETHVELVTRALDAGKHVLVEKPLAETAAETVGLTQLASGRGVLLNPVHQFPFQRGVRGLQDQLERLGTLVELSFVTSSAGGEGRDASGRRALLFEILPHPLSLFGAILGCDLVEIPWQLITLTDDDLDLGGAHDGVLLRARISLRARPTRNVLTVVGERATAHIDLFHGFSVLEAGAPSRRTKLVQPFAYGEKLLVAAASNLGRRVARSEFAYPGLRELIAAFHEAVRNASAAPIAPEEAVEVASVVERLRRPQ